MIIFEKLRWKNLLSSGNTFTEIDLNSHTHSLVIGENGAGKSTMLDALLFVLYGKPFRKINKPQLVNAINGRDLLVECSFKIGEKQYLVRRGIKPNIFEIFVNDTLINLESSTVDYQEYFEKNILKINFKSFSQIVVLGSASFVPFMQLTASNRREVVEDLLDIQIFSVMNGLLKEKINANQDKLQETQYQISNIEDKIELEKKHIKEIEDNTQDYINEKNSQIADYENKIFNIDSVLETINKEAKALLSTIDDKDAVLEKQKKLSSLHDQLISKKEKNQEDIDFFYNNHVCPSCSQGIENNHKDSIIEERKSKLTKIEEAISEVKIKIKEADKRIKDIEKISKKVDGKRTEYSSNKAQRKIWVDVINNLKKEVASKEKQDTRNDNRLKELGNELVNKGNYKKELLEDKTLLNIASVMMKDTGIKTQIISQYVPVINQLINKYLAEMDFFVNFELNESFEETIKSRFRDEFSYASFSEGEKSRLDLALLFTWRAIAKLRNSASTNLLILDEVFDGSLDNEGSEKLLNIIKTLTNNNNVFIISHKTDAYLDKFDRVIMFKKVKNFSQMNIL
jgi:DNA repair exonuclease SbcCD ATPase subunit